MLELNHKNQSKVKVVNVTEARGNFARILSDTNAHYIITKNNRAQRVIINFDEFKVLQELAEAYQKEHAGLLEKSVQSVQIEESSEPELIKSKAPAIRGMIAAQFEWVQKNQTLEVKNEEPFEIDKVKAFTPEEIRLPLGAATLDPNESNQVNESVVDAVFEESLKESSSEDAPIDFKTGDDDYFSADSNDVEDWESVLPEPTPQISAAAEFKEIAQEIEVIIPEPEPQPQREMLASAQEVSRSAEEEEYFRRYRKLYEGFTQTPADVVLPAPRREPEPVVMETMIKAPAEVVFESEEPAGRYYDLTSELSHSETPASELLTSELSEESRADYFSQPENLEDEGLPSLQELLKDLDSHHLSGEENETLDVSDIDEIISRITTD